jgi:2-polyprenyl-3-methyl-5-hydroxy-6-metoxy-1,4-benzoquinol methylase
MEVPRGKANSGKSRVSLTRTYRMIEPMETIEIANRKDIPLAVPADTVERKIGAPSSSRGLKRIGILIVAYNAVSTIAKVLQRIPADVWANVEEVVVFDDASRDHTYELAMGLKMLSGLEKLTVIKHAANLGYGGNQKAGYKYFIERGFDIAVLLHGDGQYAPEILAHMYSPLVRGEADAVFGSRMMSTYGGPLKGGMPLYKFVGNRILTYFENLALNLNLTEFHSGYRAYSLAALRQINFNEMTDVFHFDTQIIVKLHHQGFRIVEVPIPTYYGDEICYVDGIKYARDVFESVLRYRSTVRSVRSYPEYREYFQHYPIKESRHSSHEILLRWIGTRQDVLDVGCGEAFLASKIAQNDNRVFGIDQLDAPSHASALAGYAKANLDSGLSQAVALLAGQRFDQVVLADVLEHVRRPEDLLRQSVALLRPNGQLLVSVPNVANITVRLALLFGQFNYTERGILDRTHLHFFTRKNLRRFLTNHGLTIIRETASVMPIELALGVSAANPVMRVTNAILAVCTRLLPGLFGYQILVSVRPSRTADSLAAVHAEQNAESA